MYSSTKLFASLIDVKEMTESEKSTWGCYEMTDLKLHGRVKSQTVRFTMTPS